MASTTVNKTEQELEIARLKYQLAAFQLQSAAQGKYLFQFSDIWTDICTTITAVSI